MSDAVMYGALIVSGIGYWWWSTWPLRVIGDSD